MRSVDIFRSFPRLGSCHATPLPDPGKKGSQAEHASTQRAQAFGVSMVVRVRLKVDEKSRKPVTLKI